MLFPCIPKIERCCFCTRNLRVASLFIIMWSMLATCHSSRILLWPTCTDQYDKGCSLHEALVYIEWILFIINMFTMASSFAFLLGLFFRETLYFTADIFAAFGLLSAIFMLTHGILTLIIYKDSDCTNPSDGIVFILYFCIWCYFILVVNSYSSVMQEDT